MTNILNFGINNIRPNFLTSSPDQIPKFELLGFFFTNLNLCFRALRAAAKTAVDSMGRGPGVVTSIMANVLKYNQELVKQLSEVNHTTKTKESGKNWGWPG